MNRTSPAPPIGWLDVPESEGIIGPDIHLRGWALAHSRIRAVVVRLGHLEWMARIGLPRPDVAEARPGYPDNPNGGFACDIDLRAHEAPQGVERRRLSIVAIGRDGAETTLGERTVIERSVHARWQFAARDDDEPFFLVPALSGVAQGGSFGLDTRYAAYVSSTIRIGMRVPILYLRTTTGARDDHRFDPGFDTRRAHDGRAVADDALAQVLADARERSLPVLVTLNGGIWSDATGSMPEWDLTDRLEEDPANCQWNAQNEVMPDDYLKHLPGSHDSPELARALTLNVYATDVRRYKKRNLQQAAEPLVEFIQQHPELFIGVNLDPDVYINPFFAESQWYDYNPGTLRQFRHWLAGTGPYAGDPDEGATDLASYRRTPLSLDACAARARTRFRTWEEVDPPRVFSRDPSAPFWEDPWVREWEVFRRHLVALHHDELAACLVEAGIPADRIWSSQGLMAPAPGCMPLARALTSPVKNYDSGGVCLEGSKPRSGHLGAIVYGEAATNSIEMEDGGTLFDGLAAIDPGFAIVEFNTADLRHPEARPTYEDAYRALRDLWNAGARFVSPMAWNGANGLHADDPGYASHTAWRNTPLEEAARDFLLARCGLPRRSRLWTFGTPVHADDDGWSAEVGTARPTPGALEVRGDRSGAATLVSPMRLALAEGAMGALVLGFAADAPLDSVCIGARVAGTSDWRVVAQSTRLAMEMTKAGALIRCAASEDHRYDQLRIALELGSPAPIRLARVAILAPP